MRGLSPRSSGPWVRRSSPARPAGRSSGSGDTVAGSSLISQGFAGPAYFHPRPSAAGAGYDAASSGGSNLGPTSRRLIETVRGRVAAYRAENRLAPGVPVPADAVTASGSGLDPHISVPNALLQARRVAEARGLGEEAVRGRIAAHTEGRTSGIPWGAAGQRPDAEPGSGREAMTTTANNRADAFLRMIRRSQRGRLKVYLGYAAGVGKTWQMLQEGHRLKEDGIDVVIGLLETHGRADTAKLAEGLEVVPRRRQIYRGIAMEEMDSEAILRRKPQVALVDELAHTNVPGSRNAKRYEDVQDLLAAGIHVITTMNVQHLESLYNTVERAAGVKVRERLPDSVLAEADQIVNVDLTPEDLQERLREGKVYPAERIGTALANFFRPSNLENLRELTLREMAAQIDLRRHEAPPEEGDVTPDQVMVCLSSRGPNSEKLLRYASRLAGKLNRNWYAVYVQTPGEEATVIDSRTQRLLSGTLTLAKELGAMVFTYKGEDITGTILRFAREYRVGHIVLGSPAPIPFWKRIAGKKNIPEKLIEESRGDDHRRSGYTAYEPRDLKQIAGDRGNIRSGGGQGTPPSGDGTAAFAELSPGCGPDRSLGGAGRKGDGYRDADRDRLPGRTASGGGPPGGAGARGRGKHLLQRGGGLPPCPDRRSRKAAGCPGPDEGRDPGRRRGKAGGVRLLKPVASR